MHDVPGTWSLCLTWTAAALDETISSMPQPRCEAYLEAEQGMMHALTQGMCLQVPGDHQQVVCDALLDQGSS